jgi:hypothetical protein
MTPTTATLGRNDPCHCGSGQKYKRCHLESDLVARRAAAAAVRAAPAAPPDLFANPRMAARANGVGEALLQITAGRLEALPLDHVGRLLARGQLLDALRFDTARFAAAFARHAAGPAKDAAEPWRALFAASSAELVPHLVVLRRAWTDAILDRLEKQPSPDDTKALETALAMLVVGEVTHDVPVHELPLFDEVFRTQLAELGEAEDAWKGILAGHGAGQLSESAELARLLSTHPALRGQLEALSPALLGAFAPDLAGALAQTTAALTSATPPAVLALDELLWFETRFLQLLKGVSTADRSEEEVKRARSEAAVTLLREAAEQFGDAVRDRAGRLALDARLSDGARQVARQLLLAVSSEPVKVMLALVRAPDRPVQWRNALERKAFAKLRTKQGTEGLEEYATFLEQSNDLDGATRVRDVLAMRK